MMDNMMSMMEIPETTGSTDKDFANMIIKHHTDGITMGQTILKYTENKTFKSMTEKIITDQKKELLDFFGDLAGIVFLKSDLIIMQD